MKWINPELFGIWICPCALFNLLAAPNTPLEAVSAVLCLSIGADAVFLYILIHIMIYGH